MTIMWVILSLIFCAFGLSFVALYIVVARRRFGVQLGPMQAFLYRVDTTNFSFKDKALEFCLRMLKKLGFLVAIISIVIMFAGK
jgi:hypothetical protein